MCSSTAAPGMAAWASRSSLRSGTLTSANSKVTHTPHPRIRPADKLHGLKLMRGASTPSAIKVATSPRLSGIELMFRRRGTAESAEPFIDQSIRAEIDVGDIVVGDVQRRSQLGEQVLFGGVDVVIDASECRGDAIDEQFAHDRELIEVADVQLDR